MTEEENRRYGELYRREKEKYIRVSGDVAALNEKISLAKWRLNRIENNALFSFSRELKRRSKYYRNADPFIRPSLADADEKALSEYTKRLELFEDPYPLWIRDKEEAAFEKYGNAGAADDAAEILLEAEDPECVDERATGIAAAYFAAHPEADIWYADEDMIDGEGRRCHPWFKQDSFPASLLGCFYYGSMIALRKSAFEEEETEGIYKDKKRLYELVLKHSFTDSGFKKAGHTPLVLYHGKISGEESSIYAEDTECANCLWGYEPEYDAIKKAYAGEQGKKNVMLSIVIPSKDDPEMLKRCLASIEKNVTSPELQIILVDNGSNEKNRKTYTVLLEKTKKNKAVRSTDYLYKKSDFNFSKMCNRGAAKASGEYLLFLNDDTQITDGAVLDAMIAEASGEGTGAVGARLLYPDGRLQHAGVSNLATGPAHKLQGIEGDRYPYYNFAMTKMNMLAVTAACMMIKRSRFMGAGGFDEGLKVAYNDVDLCMRLFEAGYLNVQRNDLTLIHNESVSRGNDLEDAARFERLAAERDRLYSKHPALKAYDPFYPHNLRYDDPGYKADAYLPGEYRFEAAEAYENVKSCGAGNCGGIRLNIDECGVQKKFLEDEEELYVIRGWSFMEDADNARYARRFILASTDECRAYDIAGLPVCGIEKIYPDERNILLSGFALRIAKGSLGSGSYEIRIEYRDVISGKKYYKKADCRLNAE